MDELTDTLYDDEAQIEMGQSDSKGAKKKTGVKNSKGLATSFGFRKRPASVSRLESTLIHHCDPNGNDGGSTEELYLEGETLSGRSTPLARPRKQTSGAPTRTNRFGFRQSTGAKSRVGDVSQGAEEAFSTHKQSACNNNASDKISTNSARPGLPPAGQARSTATTAGQVRSTATTTVVGANGVPRTVTKQTVVLTYHTQQVPSHPANQRPASRNFSPRSSSASRVGHTGHDGLTPGGKYSFQTNQLPRTQYPALRHLDKNDKQVVNSSRKISGSSDGSREGSATDSGVSTGDCGDSPRTRRRPRNLEMVMRGAHSFHLRELNVADLDIMDEAVVTETGVIPLPKLSIHYDEEVKLEPTYEVPAALAVRPRGRAPLAEDECSPVSTLERYRAKRERPDRIRSWEEDKFVIDRAQPENPNKQNSFIKSPAAESPNTISSSKESTPSGKSDAATETWNNDAAGEAMATRSQDDFSAYSTSSVEEDPPRTEPAPEPRVPQKTIVIADPPALPHPLLMKSLNTSHNEVVRSIMINSMSSSNYSGLSVSTVSEGDTPRTLTQSNNFELAALGASLHSLIDDETSPADSLISSSTNSDSNNDIPNIERDVGSLSSSAYQTANTKTKSSTAPEQCADPPDTDTPPHTHNGGASKGDSPVSPGTPTHASGSLSLSDGRDFFDDEIADQPVLISMQRKNAEGSPSSRGTGTESEGSKSLRRSRETIPRSPLAQKNRKGVGLERQIAGAERTVSLDTLSSLASDDMMMLDQELALSVTSLHSVDNYIERLDSSFRGLNSLTEQQLRAELSSSKRCAVQQWSQLLQQNSALDQQLARRDLGVSSTTSTSADLAEVQASLPVRTARLLQRSRAQTPSDAGSGVSDGPPPAPAPPAAALLLQDVVDIKTLLLQLKRVLHEPGEEHHTMSSETLDPLQSACADPPARGNGRPLPPHELDHVSELRRQILYLQSQVEERDRLVRMLQQQMSKMADSPNNLVEDTCNVATQTDRLRPPAASNSLNTESTGLVSWSEQNGRRLSTYSDAQKTRKSVASAPAKCQCGRKLNGITQGLEPEAFDKRSEPLHLKPNSRVGSRYLQAVSGKEFHKRDLSVNERLMRKNTLYASRSIENFHNSNLSLKKIDNFDSQMKHCTSYGDLYGTAKSNGPSPIQNGQSTDTDYSSDGGYKSLPSSINCNGNTKKVSGIPRRSIERRLFCSKPSVKASAI